MFQRMKILNDWINDSVAPKCFIANGRDMPRYFERSVVTGAYYENSIA
jgi:hypothetical protein